jgi:hypothetical protein
MRTPTTSEKIWDEYERIARETYGFIARLNEMHIGKWTAESQVAAMNAYIALRSTVCVVSKWGYDAPPAMDLYLTDKFSPATINSAAQEMIAWLDGVRVEAGAQAEEHYGPNDAYQYV